MAGLRSVVASTLALFCAVTATAQTSISNPAAPEYLLIARRGWHIDVGFDAAELQSPLEALRPELPGMRYVFFGFGDEHYLLAKHRGGLEKLAALWPGRGLILATGLKSSPEAAFGFGQVIALPVTRTQLMGAENFINRSLVGEKDPIRPLAPGPYEGSLYFKAKDRYSAFHTCNTWAAEVLRAADLRVNSHGVIVAGQLWTQVRRLDQEQTR